MNCETVEEQIPSLVAGVLSEEDTAVIEAHIVQCPSCHAWLEESRELFGIWNQPTHVLPSSDFVPAIEEHLQPSLSEEKMSGGRFRSRPLLQRASLYHFGLAASLTIALFSTGTFETLGSNIAKFNTALSGHVLTVINFTSQLHM